MTSELSKNWICPECGSANLAGATECFLCGEPFVSAKTRNRPALPQTGPHVSSPLIIIALVLICVGVGLESPGLGILLIIALTPAVIRTQLISKARPRREPMTALGFVIEVVGSLFVIITVGIAAIATFFGVCMVGFMGGTLASAPFEGDAPLVIGWYAGMIAGAIAGGYVAVKLFRRIGPRK
jgi:dipeptide/tripeptide permease